MIRPHQYRRLCLEAPEGCPPRVPGLPAICFHKGDSSPQANQTSAQSGAQTQGVNNEGSGNISNTGSQVVQQGAIVISPATGGSSGGSGPAGANVNTGSQILTGSTNTINGSGNTFSITNDADIVKAIQALTGQVANATTPTTSVYTGPSGGVASSYGGGVVSGLAAATKSGGTYWILGGVGALALWFIVRKKKAKAS
ncbi:MAG: hypothetical protein WCS94_08315 [Verrucomicrobiota bacterium]